jgi:hypothetical protein
MNARRIDAQLFHLRHEHVDTPAGIALEVLDGAKAFLLVIGDEPDAMRCRSLDQSDTGVVSARTDAEYINSLARSSFCRMERRCFA